MSGDRILCAHADQNGEGAHWKNEGDPCPLTCPDCKGRGRLLRTVTYGGKVITEHCWTCGGTGQTKDGER